MAIGLVLFFFYRTLLASQDLAILPRGNPSSVKLRIFTILFRFKYSKNNGHSKWRPHRFLDVCRGEPPYCLKPSLFLTITLRLLVVRYGRFGTTYRSHLEAKLWRWKWQAVSKRRQRVTNKRSGTAKKSEDPNYTAVEAWDFPCFGWNRSSFERKVNSNVYVVFMHFALMWFNTIRKGEQEIRTEDLLQDTTNKCENSTSELVQGLDDNWHEKRPYLVNSENTKRN